MENTTEILKLQEEIASIQREIDEHNDKIKALKNRQFYLIDEMNDLKDQLQ